MTDLDRLDARAAAPPEEPDKDETISRLSRALRVATHKPHDQDGEPDPDSGFPVCSVCGAIQTVPPAPDPGAGLPWLIRFTCCGRADGVAARATWEEADALRQSYLDPGNTSHVRTAIIEDALSGSAPDPVAGLREALDSALAELDNVRWDDIWPYLYGGPPSAQELARMSMKYVGYVRADLEKAAALLASDKPDREAGV